MKNIFIDGCFDLFHFGHANALRRAKKLGLPILSDEERYEVVKSCRWVDKVVGNVPYVPSMKLIEEFGCDAAVHGDDLVTDGDGTEVYKEIKAQGKFKEFK
ncbi:ethanolamine-phosphate cytidylyltransferase [Vairimorpha apis BRL 01]|uniref:ethanolamine-phosphate cytidylyltransferase n=1 Tax=Vairimorpha apis BRL 01 TaxID=1037528 RepID=T0MBV3_9MICR|nr:ethanolamine-phosphate cytidylyltransferase [Vairimorpha apis BRL 01]